MTTTSVASAASFTLEGGRVLLSGGLADAPVAVVEGRIGETVDGWRVDATGLLVLPGIVDLHGDAFERHLAPRRGALRSLEDGLRALEGELASCGITTAWLAQFWSWQGGMRGPDFARRLCAAVTAQGGPMDLRVQLRIESGCVAGDAGAVLDLVEGYGIGWAVLADHLPHAALAAGKRPARLEGQALRAGRSPADHLALMRALHEGMDAGAVAALVAALSARGAVVGTHDDEGAAPVPGTTIAEFPVTRAAAVAAREAGRGIVLGAPNVVRGGSHGKGVSARAMIADGLCDALASDYHCPSLAGAAFALVEDGMPLGQAWGLVSDGPARLLTLADRGRIEAGARADLVVVEQATRRIVGTVAGGRIAHASGTFAERLLAAR